MSHYKSNVRDEAFNLFEVFGVDRAFGNGRFADLDVETALEMLTDLSRLAEGPIAESFADGDRNPPRFDARTFSVTVPASVRKSVMAVLDHGWDKAAIDEDLGGIPMPKALAWALQEMILGAHSGIWFYVSGACLADIVYHLGTDEQKRWAELAVEREWASTMVLCEPDAATDAAAPITAVEQGDGSWHLDGVKHFVCSADCGDLFENIFHLVLARPDGTATGKGLSLFFVPKFLFDPKTGIPQDRNGVFVTNLERKMGLKVSPTCDVAFGRHGLPAKGWLVGEVHDGIGQMLAIMEQAHMMIGTKAIATLSTGYLNALEYARSGTYDPDLPARRTDSTPRAGITGQPDVRRSLMTQ